MRCKNSSNCIFDLINKINVFILECSFTNVILNSQVSTVST
uniref:Uncharacterized protein n=1 Tax=Arundo donax TaxID=35708 RepID=A0A0A9EDR2_ARUDO